MPESGAHSGIQFLRDSFSMILPAGDGMINAQLDSSAKEGTVITITEYCCVMCYKNVVAAMPHQGVSDN